MHAWNGVPAAQLERPKGIGWWLLFIKVNLIIFYVTILFMVHILLSFFGMKNRTVNSSMPSAVLCTQSKGESES